MKSGIANASARRSAMQRITVLVLWMQFGAVSIIRPAQARTVGQEVQSMRPESPRQIVEPAELTGPAKPTPPPPTAAMRRFVESKAIQAADPKDAKTLAPALRELDALIQAEPRNSDFYLLRASLSCHAHVSPRSILADIDQSISLHAFSKVGPYPTLKDHYGLKAKVEFDNGQYQDAMSDLDAAIKQNYDSGEQIFNDGNVEPTTTTQLCVWTQPDLDLLAQKFPTDYRPLIYRGLYLSFFYSFSLDSDYKPVLEAFQRAVALNPASPLPHYFIGGLYTMGRLGGLFSTASAKCIDDFVPRTAACLALDELHRTGVRSLTRAIAVEPTFRPAYQMRALALAKLKLYRQAIRDYDKVVVTEPGISVPTEVRENLMEEGK